MVVEPGTCIAPGGKGLAHKRAVHHADLHLTAFGKGYGHGYLLLVIGVVDGAVNRVNDPQRAAQLCRVCKVGRGLFGEDVVVGEGLFYLAADKLVGLQIGRRQQLNPFLVTQIQRPVRPRLGDQHTSAPGEVFGKFKHLAQQCAPNSIGYGDRFSKPSSVIRYIFSSRTPARASGI